MLVAFHTLGCKVNQYETQAMRRQLENAGYDTTEFVPDQTIADVLVINSCTVTGESDRKLRQLLRRHGQLLLRHVCGQLRLPAAVSGWQNFFSAAQSAF